MKIAALLQKVHHLQATAMTAPQVFELATIGGARALGLDAEVGSLEPGKRADLVLFAEASPSLSNVHDPYQEIVYCASPRDVHTVWVDGARVVAGGRGSASTWRSCCRTRASWPSSWPSTPGWTPSSPAALRAHPAGSVRLRPVLSRQEEP